MLLKDINNVVILGVHLGISPSKLQQIEQENKDDLARQKMEVINFWLHNFDCSWERLAEAVKRLGGHDLLVSELNKLAMGNNCLPETESKQSGISH